MSYILEALKKSDKQRSKGKVPDLQTVQPGHVIEPEKPQRWPYFLMAALLLNALIFAAYFGIGKEEKEQVVDQQSAPPQPLMPAGQAMKKSGSPQMAERVPQPPALEKIGTPKVGTIERHNTSQFEQPAPPLAQEQKIVVGQSRIKDSFSQSAQDQNIVVSKAQPVETAAQPQIKPDLPDQVVEHQVPTEVKEASVINPGQPSFVQETAKNLEVAVKKMPERAAPPVQPPPTQTEVQQPGSENQSVSTAIPSGQTQKATRPLPRTINRAAPVVRDNNQSIDSIPVPVRKARRPLPRSSGGAAPAVKDSSKKKVVDMRQLPVRIRQALPDIRISVHAYSKRPENRIVSINGKVTKEGQRIDSDLRLEEITLDGVILSYEKYHFKVKVF